MQIPDLLLALLDIKSIFISYLGHLINLICIFTDEYIFKNLNPFYNREKDKQVGSEEAD